MIFSFFCEKVKKIAKKAIFSNFFQFFALLQNCKNLQKLTPKKVNFLKNPKKWGGCKEKLKSHRFYQSRKISQGYPLGKNFCSNKTGDFQFFSCTPPIFGGFRDQSLTFCHFLTIFFNSNWRGAPGNCKKLID